ncbi:MAG: hypothetical protein M3P04_11030 [Actinomycetota bacterium]|nr:hypothetical protein [Actinomycetota bacterium]
MNLYEYTFTGDPQTLLAGWNRAIDRFGKEEFFLNIAAVSATGLTVLDVCPTEADFQGWINGDAWRAVKADIGGDVVVTPLGEIRSAIARDTVVEVVHAHAHAH